MTAADLVLHGARLLTLEPLKEERPRVGPAAGDVGAVMDGFVASRDGAIVATGHGSAHQMVERVDGAIDVDVEGRVVMPGFVDPHTHLCYAGERWEEFATRKSGADYLAVLAAGGGIHATVRATRDTSDDDLLTLLKRRIGDAAELGTTTIEVKSGYGLDPDEELRQLRLLARAEVPAVLLPGSAFFVGYPPPEARRFIAARVPVALASDHNPGTSPLEGMPTAIALGVTLCGLTPHEAIVAATINAAHALGRGGRVGALVAGRRADIVVLDTDDERELAYRMGAPLIAEVYAAGRRVA